MALFNKFFSSRKIPSNQDTISEKLFGFNREQVRVVLFRECDFRGRKLLFDSTAIRKVKINSMFEHENSGNFAEISEGTGYMYIKPPPPDSGNLAEMIFGLVAMSYRGSYFKIHNLETPARLMLTQVFPSPKYAQRKISTSSRCKTASSQSLEHSIRLDDSGTCMSDNFSLSVHSTNSDTILICRHTLPLDVPNKFTGSTSSFICDSGVYARSSSCDGNKANWESILPQKGAAISFSNSTLYKRWIRSSLSMNSSSGSIEEGFCKSNQRSSRLGLAFIIELTPGHVESQIEFLMEHVVLLESMLNRARQAVEVAYLRPGNFLSILSRMVNSSTVLLANLLSGPLLPLNLWTSLYSKISEFNDIYSICDNNINNSINTYKLSSNNNSGIFSCSWELQNEKTLSNITKMLKTEWDSFNLKMFKSCDKSSAEIFIKDFCELLENVDIKSTNFFISTLLTAVLTHHLGWVSTCLPNENNNFELDVNIPFNPLWGQLSDFYGAIGHPTRMAQTIISGTKRKELITKIINCLTYFIRSNCDLEKNNMVRSNVYEDDKTADYICCKNSCIPKENFKQYKDHLREMLNVSTPKKFVIFPEENARKTLNRSKKSQANLNELDENKNDLRKNSSDEKVLFVLGEDEKLVNIKQTSSNFLDSIFKKYETFEEEFSTSCFKDDDFFKLDETKTCIKPSTSWSSLQQASLDSKFQHNYNHDKPFVRSQSVPPKEKEKIKEENKAKYRYAGIKFSLHQYPQVVTNYMRSKNLEMANLPFSEITKKFDQIETSNKIDINFSLYDKMNSDDEMEGLQTPSNASDLNDSSMELTRRTVQNRTNNNVEEKMKIIQFPMPKSEITKSESFSYSTSLLRGLNEDYIPNLVLQGIFSPKTEWESSLKNELALGSQNCFLNSCHEEAVAIIADTDNWEVQLVSSHTYVIDKTTSGVRVGMSQLIASMLDSLLKMWKLQVPPELCLLHIEQRLQALCLRSRALAQLLLATEFCSMEFLTSTLHLEVNDVPLLLAVASTYSPQVTQKYGISFQ